MNIEKLKIVLERKEVIFNAFNEINFFVENNINNLPDWLVNNWDKIKDVFLKFFDLIKKLEDFLKQKDWIFQISSFVDLDYDTRRDWDFYIKDKKTNFDNLLKSAKKIHKDAYIYSDIYFYFNISQEKIKVDLIVFHKKNSLFFENREKSYVNDHELYNLIDEQP